jgi:N-methylhydantoinase A
MAVATTDSHSWRIGVDVGGTHTDVIVAGNGTVRHGKALTTPGDLSEGVLNGIEVVASDLGLSVSELLRDCDRIVNGTTVVTNAVTQLRGRAVGVIVTRGFRDTFRIARGARLNVFDDHQQANVPSIVPWERILEVTERLDHAGAVVAPLADDEVRQAARTLVDEHAVEAIAIVFLWSFRNAAHESRAKEIVHELYPDLYTITSSEVHPLAREFERWNTALFTAFVRGDVATYVTGLESKLQAQGLASGSLSLFQCLGGTLLPREAVEQPLQLMDSGPVGGVIAARALGEAIGMGDFVCADMGGTSFDVALIRGGELTHSKRRALGHAALVTGLAAVDIVSIGAGGGSIAWLDRRGIPQVGPTSAGSDPGPACYGRGGTQPTVTDAMVVMNFLDPDDYLGGRRRLVPAAARDALTRLGATHGWSPERTAAAVHDIAVGNMVNALREVSIHKGHDPRELDMVAYGGMTPLLACAVAEQAGMRSVIIPPHSAAFSAWGVVMADRVRRYARTVSWNLHDADQVDAVNAVAHSLIAQAIEDTQAASLDPAQLSIRRVGAFRFLGQVWEIDLDLEDRELEPADADRLHARFVERYEEIYGVGTAWRGSPVILLDYEIIATIEGSQRPFHDWQIGDTNPVCRSRRSVFDPTAQAWQEIPVFDDAAIGRGAEMHGPAIIDGKDTTVFIPGAFVAERRKLGELQLTRTAQAQC